MQAADWFFPCNGGNINKPTHFPFSPPKNEKSCLVFPVAARAAVSSVTTERCRRKTQKGSRKARNDENMHICNIDPISFEQLGPHQVHLLQRELLRCRSQPFACCCSSHLPDRMEQCAGTT